ncbi:MAG TPA: hypothetical protein VIR04_08435 [Paralcaligenes sp.]
MQLHRTVREIADVIGRDRALFLVGQLPRCYSGIQGKKSWRAILYVPKSLKPNHPLVRILGWQDAEKLVRAFGGEILQPANCADIYRRFRDSSICRMAGAGMKAACIASVMEVSERHVKNVLRERPQEETATPRPDTARHRSTGVSHGMAA